MTTDIVRNTKDLSFYGHARFGLATVALVLLTVTSALGQASLPALAGRRLLISPSEAFQLRCLAYSPTPVGQALPTNLCTHARYIERDGPLIASAYANTIRIYGGVTIETDNRATIGVTGQFLRAAASNGLWVVVGSYVPPLMDFGDQSTREAVIDAHVDLVRSIGSEPNILMWAIGNEIDGQVESTNRLAQWYALVDDVACAIKQEQGGASGPGFGPYVTCVNGDVNVNIPGKPVVPPDGVASNVDIWAVNLYRGPTFGTLFREIEQNTTKPFWIAETGIDSYDNLRQEEDQVSQAAYASALWKQVEAHQETVIGAVLGFYSDEFWKDVDGNPTSQDFGGGKFGNGPDNYINEEWLGIVGVSPGTNGNDTVEPKAAYYQIQSSWISSCPWRVPAAPLPLISRYDAADFFTNTYNNHGGYSYANTGPGMTGAVVLAHGMGSSGNASDHCLHATLSHEAGTPFSYFSSVETLFPEDRSHVGGVPGVDMTSFDTVEFAARIGSMATTDRWRIRIEDADFSSEWLNRSIDLPALTTNFQTVAIGLQEFTTGVETVDLTRVVHVVFEAALSNGLVSATPIELDLFVDNLRISSSASGGMPFTVGITGHRLPGNGYERTITFPVSNRADHVVQCRDSLLAGEWTSLQGAPHNTGCANDSENASRRFYRAVRTQTQGD